VFYTWNEALPSERWQVKPVYGPYTETTLYGLNATATTYYFRVQARNMHGFGPKSDIVRFSVGLLEAGQPDAAKVKRLVLVFHLATFQQNTNRIL
jgi:hypothetical protein